MMGGGPQREHLKEKCTGLNVEFYGAAQPDEIRGLMKAEREDPGIAGGSGRGIPECY